jgi:hypothetical protein
MNHSANGENGGTFGCDQMRNTEEGTGHIAPTESIKDCKSLLIDLCAAFVSANGVKPDFYFAAGKALVATEMVAIDEEKGVVLHGDEDQISGLLMELQYPRGAYVARLVSNRICRFIDQVNDLGGTKFLLKIIDSDAATVEKILLPLFGVGPGFVRVYFFLAGVSGS